MDFEFSSLLWQGAAFSGAAFLLAGSIIWWLYLSPVKGKIEQAVRPKPKLAVRVAGMLGASAFLMVGGALWDASMHLTTGTVPGGEDFLWPPHLMIYGAFLLAWLVALMALREIALEGRRVGIRDPRLWVRRNPYVGAVAVASLFAIASIPGDAIWHELFGIDLTAWSPPHILLGLSSATVLVSAVGVLVQARPALKHPRRVDLAVMGLLALMLNLVYIIGVLEWELPGERSTLVDARPLWSYPLVGAVVVLFALLLAKRLTASRWAASGTALAFYAARFGVSLTLDAAGQLAPLPPQAFLLGALLLDVVPWKRIRFTILRDLASAAAYTAGYALLALPLIAARTDLQDFTPLDIALTVVLLLAASLAVQPLARLAGERLLGKRAVEASL